MRKLASFEVSATAPCTVVGKKKKYRECAASERLASPTRGRLCLSLCPLTPSHPLLRLGEGEAHCEGDRRRLAIIPPVELSDLAHARTQEEASGCPLSTTGCCATFHSGSPLVWECAPLLDLRPPLLFLGGREGVPNPSPLVGSGVWRKAAPPLLSLLAFCLNDGVYGTGCLT